MPFPKDFLWGTAASAYQIEGAVNEDGRLPCIWDVLAEGHVPNGETGADACDHYHRFREDVALMKELGLKSYRFSIAWPRVLPRGTGEVNQKGLDFYVNLVRALKEADIEPIATLYHWDLPYDLYLRGGWLNPESVSWFERYAAVMAEALSPYVRYWITFNEPQCFVGISYLHGEHAPFLDQPSSLLPATRHVLLAHGKAVEAIRRHAVTPPRIGYAPTGAIFMPKDHSEAEIERARAETFSARRGAFSIAWWCDPVILGYEEPGAAAQMGTAPEKMFTPEEWQTVRQPLDFLGINIYQADGLPREDSAYPDNTYRGGPMTAMDWPITPEVMYWGVRFLQERYNLPILVTENGMANIDFIMLDGKVHDPQRIDYMHRYLKALEKAIDEGFDVKGYLYWSFLDNYEWAEGYRKRFGLVYVDYPTQRRVPKDSAEWYAAVIRTNGAAL